MIDFGVDIKIDGSAAEQAVKKVTTEMTRLERATKEAEDTIKRAVAAGEVHWSKAADAQKRLTREIINSDEAIEKAQRAATGFAGALSSSGFANFGRQITEAAGALGDFGLAGEAIGGFVGKLRDGVEALASWRVAGLAANDSLIEMRNLLRGVTDNERDMNTAMQLTRRIADETLTSWRSTIDVYSRISGVTKDLGFTIEHTGRFTKTLTELMQTSGRSTGEVSSAMLQLSQSLGSGVLQGDEFKSIAENMPMILDRIAEHMHTTRGALKQLASDGKITTQVLVDTFDQLANKADAAFASMEKTFAQRAAPLANELSTDPNKLSHITSGIFSGNTLDSLDEAGKLFGKLPELAPGLEKFADALGVALPPDRVSAFNVQLGKSIELVDRLHGALGGGQGGGAGASNDNTIAPFVEQIDGFFKGPMFDRDITAKAQIAIAGMAAEFGNLIDPVASAKLQLEQFHDVIGAPFVSSLGAVSTGLKGLVDDFVKRGSWDKTLPEVHRGLSEIEKLFHSIVDPLRNFNRDTTNLDTLFKSHRITLEQYNTTLEKLEKQLTAADLAMTRFATHSVMGGGFGPQPAMAGDLGAATSSMYGATAGIDLSQRLRDIEQEKRDMASFRQQLYAGNLYSATGERQGYNAWKNGDGSEPEGARFKPNMSTSLGQQEAALYTKRWTEELEHNKKAWEDVDKAGGQALGHIEDSIVQLVTTGKASFSQMVDSILNDLARLATHRLLMSILNAATGGGGGVIGAIASGSSPEAAYGGAHAYGGSYTAPRTGGGVDSIPVLVHVSPGERMDFTPAGQSGPAGGMRAKVVYNEDRHALLDMLDTPDGVAVIAEIHRKNPHLTRRR